VVNGAAEESVLDSYDQERLPVMHALLESVKTQCALQFNFEPDGVALKRHMARNIIPQPDVQRKLVLELCGLEAPYAGDPGSHPLCGRHLPDFDLVTAEGKTWRVAELLRGRRFVLLDLEGFSNQFKSLDVGDLPITVVQARAANAPACMKGVTGLLIRPDAYIAWAGYDAARGGEVRGQLEKWFKQ